MSHFLLKANGTDAPGITAAVTGALASQGFNVEDTSMTRLGGYFVMLFVVDAPGISDSAKVKEAVEAATSDFSLEVSVESLSDEMMRTVTPRGERWAVTIYGSHDKPGVVSTVTSKLADMGANIDDITTRIISGGDAHAFTVLIDVTVPAGSNGQSLARELTSLGNQLGISCQAHPLD